MANTLLSVVWLVFGIVCISPQIHGKKTGNDTAEWEIWKDTYGKVYKNESVNNYRKAIWRANLELIKEHNEKPENKFKLEMNHLGDLNNAEYRKLLGVKYFGNAKPHGTNRTIFQPPSDIKLNHTVDWRDKGYVTPVKDQGEDCGSCWAFSATGSLEGQHFKKTGKLVSLSEQNLIDCSSNYSNNTDPCVNGSMIYAFNYIRDNGIATEESYPYLGKQQDQCYFDSSTIGATLSGYKFIKNYSEYDLQVAVATVGPISVGIDANHTSFQFYSNNTGVYYEANCSSEYINHAVLVVGYGTTLDGEDYWLVKNSYGVEWGLAGYILMARNRSNHCGIATFGVFPLVEAEIPTSTPISTTSGVATSEGFSVIIWFLFWLRFSFY